MNRSTSDKFQGNTSRMASSSGSQAEHGNTSRMTSSSRSQAEQWSTLRMASSSRSQAEQWSTLRMASSFGSQTEHGNTSRMTSSSRSQAEQGSTLRMASSSRSRAEQDIHSEKRASFVDAPTAPTMTNTNTAKREGKNCKFAWQYFEGYYVPYIIRVINGEHLKFVSVRMAETHLLKDYLKCLHPDIYTCLSIKSYFITDDEAKVLNEINQHSDGVYAKDKFIAGKDHIVTLDDVQEFYTFMDVCLEKIQCKITPGRINKCGFVRINSESAVPYCTKDGQQFLPLFYFEGSTENVMPLAVTLDNWNLAYLKFCCKVQGIKAELYNSDSVESIDLDSIKSCYSSESFFEDYWPSRLVDTHLLIDQQSNHVHTSGAWIRAPIEVKQDKNIIPGALIEPAPPITQSIPKIQNTYRNGWPANKLGGSYNIQSEIQHQGPSKDSKYCGTSNQNVAPQHYNTGSTMSQGRRMSQQVQQQQQRNIISTHLKQTHRDQPGHYPKNPQRREMLRNLKPLPGSFTIEVLDSPPSSPVHPTV
eukprot:XP_016663314.1 PREDICTED: uncharacterized protein LOC103310545 [Acyrthosiphon pisum]